MTIAGHARRTSAFELSGDLGSRLRSAREARHIGVRSLARRIQISAAFISQIEHGRATPSVATLLALVRELDISLDALLGPPEPAIQAVGAPASNRRLGAVHCASVVSDSALAFEARSAIYAVGASPVPLRMPPAYAGRGYGHVISGCIGVVLARESYELEQGDSITLRSALPCSVWCTGAEPANVVWLLARRRGS